MTWEKWAAYAQTQISVALDCADDRKEADGLLAYAAENIERARNELRGKYEKRVSDKSTY